ncbi:MAG: hypothetical protein KF819_35965 [Labilithrix sp.]|nr:hypothetical protein [Labilithrix sp.]
MSRVHAAKGSLRVESSRRPRLALFAALASTLAAGGCALVLGFEDTTLRTNEIDGSPIDEGQPIPEVDGGVDAGPSRITVSPSTAIVRRGRTLDLTVSITRGNDIGGTVTVRPSNLPLGVTATAPEIAPPAVTGTVRLTAAANATLGPRTIQLTIEGGPATLPSLEVPLLVADGSGAFDVTFDTDGFVFDASRGLDGTFFALALQVDGRILAGGAGAAPTAGWMARRYSSGGANEAAFQTASAGLPADGELRALAIDGLGRIVCVGTSAPLAAAVTTFSVARLTPAGALDASFGGVQRLTVLETPQGSVARAVAIQPDDMIVVVGSRTEGASETGLITRYKVDGTRDMAFNGGAPIAIANTRFIGVSIEASGAIVAAGSSTGGALPSYIVTRRTPTGAADATFGTAGTASFGNTYRANGFVRLEGGSLALVGDVRQGVAGYTAGVVSGSGAPVFARAFATVAGAGYYGVAAQGTDRFVAAGHSTALNGEARVDRIFVDGGKDGTFSDGGVAVIEPGGTANAFDVTLYAAAVQPDGRILAAGNRSNAGAVIYRLWP